MKKQIILALLLICSFAVSAQTISITDNPFEITTADSGTALTTTHQVNLTGTDSAVPRLITVVFSVPATNVGTIKINTINSTMTTSKTLKAGSAQTIILTVRDRRFWIEFSNDADTLEGAW